MPDDLKVHIGEGAHDVGARFVAAWKRAERGELTVASAEHHVSFEDFATFPRTMSPKRVALLRHLHGRPAKSVRALALALGRDYRRVHQDVEALSAAGLLERDAEGLRTGYDTVHVETRIALRAVGSVSE